MKAQGVRMRRKVKNHWLAVVLDLFQLHVHSVIPCLFGYQQNHHQKVFNWETAFVQGD